MNFLLTPIITTRRKTVLVLVTGMLMMVLMLSFIVGGIANSVQAQKPSPPTKTKDIFKVIVTLIGLNKTSGDIVSFVNVGGITQVKTFNAAKLVPMRGNNGTLEILFTFPNATINTGAKFRACTMLVKDLRMSCEKGQNSPALRPEFVDIYLSSAKSIKMSSSSSVDKKLGK
jgi:hypothetical protein